MTLVPNPNPYEWKHWEIDYEDDIPFVKKAGVSLEKNGKIKDFLTQEAVDEAWKKGWHNPGKPETADFVDGVKEFDDSEIDEPTPNRTLHNMNKANLMALGKVRGLELPEEMENKNMRAAIVEREAEIFTSDSKEEEDSGKEEE